MDYVMPPTLLWHYTDANGLYGIVSSAQLRFGDARFLNDRTERVHGEQLLKEVFAEFVANDHDGTAAAFRDLVGRLRQPDRLYVCSFSATKESISQWQRYGADGTGYCIGFRTTELDALLDRDQISREAMLYDEAAQRQLLHDAVFNGIHAYRKLDAARRDRPKKGYDDYLFTDMDIDSAVLRLKNPFFRDEEEWRYFFSSDDEAESDDFDEEFAVRGSYIKPFLQLPRPRKKTKSRLPIETIVCGPRLDADLAVLTVGRFMKAAGYDVRVEHSRLAAIWR